MDDDNYDEDGGDYDDGGGERGTWCILMMHRQFGKKSQE